MSDELWINLDAPDTHGPKPDFARGQAFGRSLRVALAMKGGVSLAVWIGGAVAELDILRRIRLIRVGADVHRYLLTDPTDPKGALIRDRARVYAAALEARQYDRIEFDVLAGASAGGLNSVLYGVAQRQGVAVDAVLDVWLDSGDIWKLLRRPGLPGVESALMGDEYFWPRVGHALRTIYGTTGNPDHVTERIVVDLSATIVDHEDLSKVGPQEQGGHFHFVGDLYAPDRERGRAVALRPVTPLPDKKQEPAGWPFRGVGGEYDADLARLAYAARSTSSFPGAFEPALIWSPPTTPLETGQRPTPTGEPVNMQFAFHLQRDGVDGAPWPFRIVDGGVTDNVPIDRAFRAVRDMPADSFGNRAILYLEPDPKAIVRVLEPSGSVPPPAAAAPSRRRKDGFSNFVRTVRAGIGGRGIRESAEDEIGAIEEYRRQLYLEQGRDEAYAVVAAAAAPGWDRVRARRAYVRYRSAADFGLLTRVLCNPSLWQLGSDLPERPRRDPVGGEALVALDARLIRKYDELVTSDKRDDAVLREGILEGAQSLVDASRSALAWLRELEELAFLGQFALRVRSDTEKDKGSAPDPHPALLLPVGDVRPKLMEVSANARRARDAEFDAMLLARENPPEGPPPSVVAGWLKAQSNGVAAVASDWATLDRVTATLVSMTKALGADAVGETADGLRESPWAAVPSVPVFEAADLAPFAAARGIPEPVSAIRFASITGSEAPSPDLEFPQLPILREAQIASIVESWLPLGWDEFRSAVAKQKIPSHLDAEAKLAGSTLFHFGAFLSTTWRSNDWWWGRLDAAAGILRFIDSLPKPDPDAESTLHADITAAQVAVLAHQQTVDSTLPANDPRTPRSDMSAGAHTLSNLRPGYVVAIASRGVRIVARGLGRGWGPAQAAARVLVPPVLAAAPLIAHPIRAVAGIAVVLAALAAAASPVYGLWRLLGIEDRVPDDVPAASYSFSFWFWASLGALAFIGIGVWAIVRWSKSAHRWRALGDLADELSDRRRRSRTAALLFAILGVVLAVATGFAVYFDQGLSVRAWTILLAAVGSELVAMRMSYRLPDAVHHKGSRALWIVVAALAALLAILPEFTRPALAALERSVSPLFVSAASDEVTVLYESGQPIVLQSIAFAVCAALLAFVLGWGWLGGVWIGKARGIPWAIVVLILGAAWVIIVALITGAIVGLVTGFVELTFPRDNAVITSAVAVTVIAWLVGSFTFWYLGEIPSYLNNPASDKPAATLLAKSKRTRNGPPSEDDGPSEEVSVD
jgi:hypothetical protein